ncbi:hypothetical protein [Streptomyces sp. NPDC046862]|uniref:hypothetical protein n=1 Tax=Streptomyces sp. NPDC046862 TaxID=3154603 RepID=UPI003452A71C
MRPRTWVLVLGAVFALLQLANVTGRDTPDSRNYVSYALGLRGDGKREAAGATIDWVCAGKSSMARRKQSVDVGLFLAPDTSARVAEACRDKLWREVDGRLRAGQTGGYTAPFSSPRFMRIFEARPGYPALLVPFVTVFGVTWGVWLAGVLVAVAGGVLAFLVLRTLGAPPVVALTGQVLFYVLPCGATAMRPMTEGLLLDLTLAALWGCALAVEGRGREGAALVGGALGLLFAVKHSQALFLAVCLVGVCAVTAVRRRGRRSELDRPLLLVGAVAGGGALVTVVVAWLLRFPSTADSVQDLLTCHFRRPDRARPWPEFWQLEANFWAEWLRRQFWEPLFLTGLVAGAWGAVRQRPAFAGFLFAAAGTGFLTHAAHPDINIWGGRLIVLAWLLPVIGLPLLLERLTGAAAAAVAVPGPSRRDTSVAQ